jgi:hypothetical protein
MCGNYAVPNFLFNSHKLLPLVLENLSCTSKPAGYHYRLPTALLACKAIALRRAGARN